MTDQRWIVIHRLQEEIEKIKRADISNDDINAMLVSTLNDFSITNRSWSEIDDDVSYFTFETHSASNSRTQSPAINTSSEKVSNDVSNNTFDSLSSSAPIPLRNKSHKEHRNQKNGNTKSKQLNLDHTKTSSETNSSKSPSPTTNGEKRKKVVDVYIKINKIKCKHVDETNTFKIFSSDIKQKLSVKFYPDDLMKKDNDDEITDELLINFYKDMEKVYIHNMLDNYFGDYVYVANKNVLENINQ